MLTGGDKTSGKRKKTDKKSMEWSPAGTLEYTCPPGYVLVKTYSKTRKNVPAGFSGKVWVTQHCRKRR
jgi:hypothetical protein